MSSTQSARLHEKEGRVIVCGIDLSSFFVDIVYIETGVPRWARISLGVDGDAFDRSRGVLAALKAETPGLTFPSGLKDCEAIGIAEPRGYNPGPAYRVQGALLQAIPRTTLVQPWIPSQWRKKVGLPGNCKKEGIMAHVRSIFGTLVDDWPQDACDAWCIAEATRLALQKG